MSTLQPETSKQQAAASDKRKPLGRVLARGLGWGALLGTAGGIILPLATDLLTFRDSGPRLNSLLLGIYAAPFGLLFGAVAGLIVAGCFLPLSTLGRPKLVARLVAAAVAPVVVAILSLAVFHPRLEVGPNETQEHLIETILLYYILPGGLAAVGGAVFGGRLAGGRAAAPEIGSPST